MNTMHVHVYDETTNELLEERDLELIDEYDEYKQFGFAIEGKWIELRVYSS